ncbi:MAG: hypothetical protein ACE5KI_03395 [Dehalococcoidia bacterium]
MMVDDNTEAARVESENLDDQRIFQTWDPERRLGDLYARTLKLRATAWDVYLLYARGVKWTGDEPPEPTFWMYQLPTDAGVDGKLLLEPGRFARELLSLLGNETKGDRPDLALELHAKGLFNVKRERNLSSLDDLAESIQDPDARTLMKEYRHGR